MKCRIDVPHLGSSTPPCWPTRWTTRRTSWGRSTCCTLRQFSAIFVMKLIMKHLYGTFWAMISYQCPIDIYVPWPIIPYCINDTLIKSASFSNSYVLAMSYDQGICLCTNCKGSDFVQMSFQQQSIKFSVSCEKWTTYCCWGTWTCWGDPCCCWCCPPWLQCH